MYPGPLPPIPSPPAANPFFSLRTKFVLFVSLIIVIVCSGLSWYFAVQQSASLTKGLTDRGALLARNLASGSRYSLIAEDQISLARFAQGVMEVDEVVYVVMTNEEGRELLSRSKGRLSSPTSTNRMGAAPIYPDAAIARRVLAGQPISLSITPFTVSPGETLYDFALAVQRRTDNVGTSDLFGLETQEQSLEGSHTPATGKTYGVIQVGLTAAPLQASLATMVRDIARLTIVIILLGILATLVLADRIVKPLRVLSGVASRVAGGDLTVSVMPTTRDEVGTLAGSFNRMTRALVERDQSLSQHVDTIMSQVAQLTMLNKTGEALTSTLDADKLTASVLDLLVERQAFSRLLLLLYDPHRVVVSSIRAAGLPPEDADILARMEMRVLDDDSLLAHLLLRGEPARIDVLADAAPRLPPGAAEVAHRLGIRSFVAVPLRTTHATIGVLAGDRGALPCTEADLNVLTTIASQMAVAIENARAYRELELLTQHLEERVTDRTMELEQANQRLREMDHLKSAFVSVVSHELRTPMTSIKGYVENMLHGLTGELTDKQSHYLGRMKLNVERLTRLINDLLDLSRIEMGRLELRRTAVCVRDVSGDVIESCQPLAQDKGISLTPTFPAQLQPVSADRDKLTQVLTNLIQNSIKFTPEGGHVRVEVRSRDDGFIQINVIDTGAGIPSDELDKVFLRFYRGATASPTAQGAGLGLTIAKNLVELHGGRIWATSTLGTGSCFSFTVPLHSPSTESST